MDEQPVLDLERHREAVDHAIRGSGMHWTDWPRLAADELFPAEVRLSAMLLLLSSPARNYHADRAIAKLRRRRLPWDADAATMAVYIVARMEGFDGQRAVVALRGAEQVCLAGGATEGMLAAVRQYRAVLGVLPAPGPVAARLSRWLMPETVALIERVLASATPPGILDLSVLRDGDTWGAPARDAAREFPAHEVAPLVRLLSTLGPQKPSKSWRRSVLEATSFQTARELLREWLRLAANADIVPPDEHAQLGFSGAMLFAHGNDDLVRSAVFAAQELPHEEWVPELLGILARRGAATSGGQAMTGALALSVASASVDSLAGRASPADKMVLAELFEDLSRRDLVRRIGKYLGLDEDVIAQRDQAIRRAKAAAVRQKADPAPREARAAMDVLVRIHFAPLLKQHGFKARGRTFRRISPDRVDVVAIGSFGLDQFALSYGTRFSTSWPPQDPAHLNEASLDIRHAEQHGIAPDEVQALAKRLSSIIIPFLDSMGRYELVRSYVENGTGAPAGSRGIDGWMGPPAWGFLGLLALAVKDRPAAVTFLTKKYDFTQGLFESNPSYGAELDIWRESLKRAVDLPDSLETGGFGGRADEDTL